MRFFEILYVLAVRGLRCRASSPLVAASRGSSPVAVQGLIFRRLLWVWSTSSGERKLQ